MRKPKLTIEEQIEDLKNKGVTFDKEYSEEDAKTFLRYNNYYFKLKSYARNYVKKTDDKYINLDFSYLVELSKLDMYLRKIIINMCLDLEHILKTQLLFDVSKNEQENGYDIVEPYFFSYDKVESKINSYAAKHSICSDLTMKHKEESDYAIWHIVELISFGDFIGLYETYNQQYGRPDYHVYLKAITFLRNAAAHSNCILNSLTEPQNTNTFTATKQLLSAVNSIPKISNNASRYMENPIIHDFVALIFVYTDVLGQYSSNRNMLKKQIDELKHFFIDEDGRVMKNKDYFSQNNEIKGCYYFICDIIGYVDNYNNKPKKKRKGLLKKS